MVGASTLASASGNVARAHAHASNAQVWLLKCHRCCLDATGLIARLVLLEFSDSDAIALVVWSLFVTASEAPPTTACTTFLAIFEASILYTRAPGTTHRIAALI